jgi:transposase
MSGKRNPEEFKIEAVKQVVACCYSVSSVAARLDIATHRDKEVRARLFIHKELSDAQVEIC